MNAPEPSPPARTSRARYDQFRTYYKEGRLDELARDDVEERDEQEPKSRGSRRHYLREYATWLWPHRWAAGVIIVLAIIIAGFEMIQPLFMRYIVDNILIKDAPSATKISQLHYVGLLFLSVITCSQLLDSLKNYNQRKLNVRFILTLRKALFERLLHLPLQKLSDMKTGGIISRLSGDIDKTTGLLQLAVISPGVSVIRLLVAMGILFYLNWKLALTALGILPGIMLISFWVSKRIRPIYRTMRKDNADLDARVSETFGGIRVVRAFQRQLRELADYLVGRHTIVRKELFAHRRELVLWGSWGFLLASVNCVIMWYGGYLAISDRATVGDIMAFQWYTFLLLNPVWQIVNSFSEMQRSLASMERVFEILDLPPDKPDKPDAQEAPQEVVNLTFQHVGFEYVAGRPVIQDFDLEVAGGSVVALVGRSGAGKTTITDLVARFYDPTQGRLLLNDIDLRDLRLASYRERLAVVQQDVFLFDGTVADNIAYGRRDAPREEIVAAAEQANAHEFIFQLPDAYDSIIGERGVKLSGGQCQRLSIARAILADPQILILDEATSNLDTESEQLIQQSLERLLEGRTTFVIAHRLSTIAHADLIVVMDQGTIIEQGAHDELMTRRGEYFKMVTRQRDAMASEWSA
ncbi:MAG: ABC transporter ATP-binding protein [Planctomycetota bacterium]